MPTKGWAYPYYTNLNTGTEAFLATLIASHKINTISNNFMVAEILLLLRKMFSTVSSGEGVNFVPFYPSLKFWFASSSILPSLQLCSGNSNIFRIVKRKSIFTKTFFSEGAVRRLMLFFVLSFSSTKLPLLKKPHTSPRIRVIHIYFILCFAFSFSPFLDQVCRYSCRGYGQD